MGRRMKTVRTQWLRVLAIAIPTSVIGAVLTLMVSDFTTKSLGVNDYSGRRLMLVWCYYTPFGGALGALAGVICALRAATRAMKFGATVRTATLFTTAAVAVGGVALYLATDKPPSVDGKPLVLEFEVRVPATVLLPEPVTDTNFYPSLRETIDADWYAVIDPSRVVKNDADTIVPGRARLRSSRATQRSLLLAFGNAGARWQRIYLPLPGRPAVQDSWSDWIAATEDFHGYAIPQPEKMALRYRVRATEWNGPW